MPVTRDGNYLICHHSAFTPRTDDDEEAAILLQGFTGRYEMSYEMLNFLLRFNAGNFDVHDNSDTRCFTITKRKSCYNPLLIDGFGLFTEAGKAAAFDAKTLGRLINRLANRPKLWHQCGKMDEIIPYGRISRYAVQMLQSLWIAHPDHGTIDYFLKTPISAIKLETTDIEGDAYILLERVRNNMSLRDAANELIKFGLVNLVNLPKPLNAGRGRPPAGISLTTMGKRFFEDYLAAFDSAVMFQARVRATAPRDSDEEVSYHVEAPRISMADVVPYDPTAFPVDASTPSDEHAVPDAPQPVSDVLGHQEVPLQDHQEVPERDVLTKPSHESRLPKLSDSSDVVDGENLRDIFG